jgi:hypothetical protein
LTPGWTETGEVGSKYDDFWAGLLPQVRLQLQLAAAGGAAMVSVPDLPRLGARQSWYGMAEVRAQGMTCSSGAHAMSLGKTIAASGICEQWPERAFRFTIGSGGDMLTITAIAGHHRRVARPVPGSGGQLRPARPLDRRLVRRSEPAGGDLAPGRGAGGGSDAGEFYRILDQLAARLGGPRRLRECTGRSGCPPQGVYFFFEDGETRADGGRRVVRVGTHALTATSKATLWGRLSQHRGQLAGRNPGGGNHRGSVFRRHVGAALIRRDGLPDDLLASWLDRRRPPGERASQEPGIEREVSDYIGQCRSCGSAFQTEPTAATSRATASRCFPAWSADQIFPAPAGSAAPLNEPKSAGRACGTSSTSLAAMNQRSSSDWPLLDADVIQQMADRLVGLANGTSDSGHQYPDLLRWSPPRTQADALGQGPGGLVVLGLGPVQEVPDDPIAAPTGDAAWQWLRLATGQTLLIKRRHAVPDFPAEAVGSEETAAHGGRRDAEHMMSEVEAARESPAGRRNHGARGSYRASPLQLETILSWLEQRHYEDDAIGYAVRRVMAEGTPEQLIALVATLRERLRGPEQSKLFD